MPLINIANLEKLSVKIQKHDVPEWGGHVCVCKFNVVQRDMVAGIHKEASENEDWSDAMVATVISGTVDEDGNQIFTESNTELLKNQDGVAVQGIYEAILKFNGMSKDDVEEAEAVKP